MAKTIFSVLVAAVLVLGGSAGLLIFAHSEPSTEALDSDLRAIQTQINEADIASSKYQGGLIGALIDVRAEVLRTTEAMLKQKKLSLIRRIDLRFSLNGTNYVPSQEKLRDIETHISETKEKIQKGETEAALKGGLIQAMALMTVETDRMALSQLYWAYFNEKYGLGLPSIHPPHTPVQEKANPGTLVKDKDAL